MARMEAHFLDSLFLIFAGAAAAASLALFTRQPLLMSYIALGCLFGPHSLGWVDDAKLLGEISEIGIIFLLFLLGLDLPLSKLRGMFGRTSIIALVTSAAFFAIGYALMLAFGFTQSESIIAGIAVTFSSTIMGIKLLPTTVLHHRHVGEIVISLLLLQDFLAILALLYLASSADPQADLFSAMSLTVAALPVVAATAFLGVRYAILPLIAKFDAFEEFIFLIAVGWCLGIASLAEAIGLSFTIGGFIAGVALATSPIAQYIATSLRPLRDFFLVLFFFTVGAGLDPVLLLELAVPTLALTAALILAKPAIFAGSLKLSGESTASSWEVGFRLGQASEFSLLVTFLAVSVGLMGGHAAHIVQGATVLTLVLSTYLVIFRYPSPIAVSARLRRD